MSTVKISQLPQLPSIAANTSNTLFVGVDIPTGTTGKFTATTLAQQLYANNYLRVGYYEDVYPNSVATMAGFSNNYIQTILENTSNVGTSDIVVQTKVSTDTKNFINMGYAGNQFVPGSYNSLGSSTHKLDGYLYVQGDTAAGPGGNLVIGTSTSGKLVRFVAGGVDIANVVMTLTPSGPSINSGAHLAFGDGSTQSVAAAPANYTQSAFDAANTAQADLAVNQGINVTQNNNIIAINQYAASAYTQANVTVGVDATQNTNITSVNQYAASAYAQANTNANNIVLVNQFAQNSYNVANAALANTTGTFAGDLTITGNVTTNFVRSKSTTINDNTPLAQFSGSLNTLNPTNSGYIIHAVGREGLTSRVVLDTVGTGAVPNFLTRTARGTNLAPTPVQFADVIGRFSSFGYGNTAFGSSSDARIDLNATENFTDANHGTSITLHTTPIGTNNITRIASFSTGNTIITSANAFISSNTTITGFVDIVRSNLDLDAPLVHINSADDGAYVAPSNSYYMLHITGKANNATRVVLDSFGVNTYPLLSGRMGRGSAAAPAATANNDVLMRIVGNGYTGTQFPSSSPTKIDFVATENFSDTNRGTTIQFWNTPNGSNTIQKIATFNANEVSFTGAVYPQKGFIYTPVIYPGAQTAITLDISDGPLVRAQTSTGLTVTLSNFVAGKVIELWVTNTSGSTQSFTHGVSAMNSTVGSTSYNMSGGSTISARYVCLDGTLANTMCSIVHA